MRSRDQSSVVQGGKQRGTRPYITVLFIARSSCRKPMLPLNGIDLCQLVPMADLIEKGEVWDDMDIYLDKTKSEEECNVDHPSRSGSRCSSYTSLASVCSSTASKESDKDNNNSNTASTRYDPSTTSNSTMSFTGLAYLQSLVDGRVTCDDSTMSKGAWRQEVHAAMQAELHNVNGFDTKIEKQYEQEMQFWSPPSTPLESPISEVFDDENRDFSDDSKETILTAASLSNEISDDDLINLSVRELNRKLKGIPRASMLRLKQRRRLLKNRGYAQKCRTRRVQQYRTLSEDNADLYKQINDLRNMVRSYKKQRDDYKHKYERLLQTVVNGNQSNIAGFDVNS